VRRTGAVNRHAMSIVYNFGETWTRLVFQYALHHDRELLRTFIPDMEKAIRREPAHWLGEFLEHARRIEAP
jgi:hypothetical protein